MRRRLFSGTWILNKQRALPRNTLLLLELHVLGQTRLSWLHHLLIELCDFRMLLNLHMFAGHNSEVRSLDFHPKKTDLFCSCDDNGEIWYWNASRYSCFCVSKGGTAQVRFQPRIGHLLAAAVENVVSIIDVETNVKTLALQGHNKEVHSICWDSNGDHLASVGQDSVKIWSLTSGECIHELSSNRNQFSSCIFHPRYPKLPIIGAYQTLELWDTAENRYMMVQAREGTVAYLVQSPFTGIVASVSHDICVKIWK